VAGYGGGMSTLDLATMPGDGVGPEVVAESLKVTRAAAERFGFTIKTTDYPHGAAHYLETGRTISDDDLTSLGQHDAILFGAVGVDPAGMAKIPQGVLETEILLKMRFGLDQYVNLRPVTLLPNVQTPLAGQSAETIDFTVVRENTEGLYCGQGGFLYKGTPHEVANQIEVTTRHGVERVIRYAFETAKREGRDKVTLVAKTNVLRFAHDLWARTFREVAREYGDIAADYQHVDACCMYMVTNPAQYGVIVTTNMFGDILTDLGAAISGGMGVAASGNLDPERRKASMFEPVHGSAPDIAGQGKANPTAAILSAAMMLDHCGHTEAAKAVKAATVLAMGDAASRTADLGGSAKTQDVGDAVVAALGRGT
jgi:3-isopropylmalate dehydrogenase